MLASIEQPEVTCLRDSPGRRHNVLPIVVLPDNLILYCTDKTLGFPKEVTESQPVHGGFFVHLGLMQCMKEASVQFFPFPYGLTVRGTEYRR